MPCDRVDVALTLGDAETGVFSGYYEPPGELPSERSGTLERVAVGPMGVLDTIACTHIPIYWVGDAAWELRHSAPEGAGVSFLEFRPTGLNHMRL